MRGPVLCSPSTSRAAPPDTATSTTSQIPLRGHAALLGIDYNHDLNLVNWNTVDAPTEKLVLGLGGSVDFGDLVDSVRLLRL